MTAKEIIERICKDNSLTLRQLAELAGIKEQSLYDIKNDRVKKVSELNAQKIAAVFPQYSPMWLMTGNEAFLNQRGTTTNVNVNMGDSVHNGIVAKNGSRISSSSVSADTSALTQQIAELQAENKILKEQVSDLTKSILNLTKQQLK